jgi:hypothetical protein
MPYFISSFKPPDIPGGRFQKVKFLSLDTGFPGQERQVPYSTGL